MASNAQWGIKIQISSGNKYTIGFPISFTKINIAVFPVICGNWYHDLYPAGLECGATNLQLNQFTLGTRAYGGLVGEQSDISYIAIGQ